MPETLQLAAQRAARRHLLRCRRLSWLLRLWLTIYVRRLLTCARIGQVSDRVGAKRVAIGPLRERQGREKRHHQNPNNREHRMGGFSSLACGPPAAENVHFLGLLYRSMLRRELDAG